MTSPNTEPMGITVVAHGVKPEDLSRNIQYRNSGVLPPRPRAAMKRVAELVERAVSRSNYHPGREVVVSLEFPFTSSRSDVDGPIKRTIDAVQQGVRAAYPDEKWDDKAVTQVLAKKVAKSRPFRITMFDAVPDEG